MKTFPSLLVALTVATLPCLRAEAIDLTRTSREKTEAYKRPPLPNEKVLGTISVMNVEGKEDTKGRWGSPEKFYYALFNKAQELYPGKDVDVRQLMPDNSSDFNDGGGVSWKGPVQAKVVERVTPSSVRGTCMENLTKAMDQALQNIPEGSKLALDAITISDGIAINRDELKDNLTDNLMDKGYKVVSKDFLQKQADAQAGSDAAATIGYFVKIKVSKPSVRVQLINATTGEYESNVNIATE